MKKLNSIRLAQATFVLSSLASAASVQYSLRSQVPQIAFVGQQYQWAFSAGTFRADQSDHDASSLTYRADSLPSWLLFDPISRTFSGTPSTSDVGSRTLQIYAAEVDDSETVDSFQLIVSSDTPPTEPNNFAKQFTSDNDHISSADVVTETSGGPGVRIRQAWSFSIGLRWDTFASPNGRKIHYSATLANRDPLPSWISFDEDQMTFDGVTPKIRSEGDIRTFEITLYGAEREGYAAIEDTFSFAIEGPLWDDEEDTDATHTLSQVAPLTPVNVSAGCLFSYDFDFYDFKGLVLDEEIVQRHNLTDILVDARGYSWLSYDNHTSRLSGTPPMELLHESRPVIPIQVLAKYDNLSVSTNFTLNVLPSAFNSAVIPPVVAQPSSHLSLDLNQYFVNGTGGDPRSLAVTMTLEPQAASKWLSLSQQAPWVVSGTVPASVGYTSLTMTFHATNPVTNATSIATVLTNLSPPQDRSLDGAVAHHNSVVIGATVGTIVGVVFLLLLFAFYRWFWSKMRQDDEVEPYEIDHGLHGDRLAAGVAEAKRAGAAGYAQYGEYEKAEGEEDFENINLDGTDNPYPSRPMSVRSASSSAAHSTDARISKATFFQKLKALSERSISSSNNSGPTSKHHARGKENVAPQPSSSGALSTGGRIAMMFGFVSRGSVSSSGSRPVIGRPMPMPPGSAGAAYKIGMRTGTTPSPPMSRSPSIQSVTQPPPAVLPSVSTGSIRDDIFRPPRPRGVSISKSLNAIGNKPAPLMASSSQNSGVASTAESGETWEAGVDSTPWAVEPSFVWASGKLKASPQRRKGPSGSSVPHTRSSLDSVVPKRRKDFGPPPRLVTPREEIRGPEVEPSRSLTTSLDDIEIPSNRMSAVSFRSVDGDTSHVDDLEDHSAVIHTVSQRQTITTVATPELRVRGSDDSMRFAGTPLKESPRALAGIQETEDRPRLVSFNSERKLFQAMSAHEHAASQAAVVDGASKENIAPPKLAFSAFDHGSTVKSLDMDEKLGLGIDYVRAFGVEGAPADPVVIRAHAAAVPSVGSDESWDSYDVTTRKLKKPTYGYSHPNGDISGPSSSKDSPSLRSMGSSVTTPESTYQHPQQLKHGLTPVEDSSSSSLRRSTHRILVASEQPFNFSIPISASIDADGPELVAKQDHDGKDLPNWLRFDRKEMEFWGVPPTLHDKDTQMLGVSVWQAERCISVFIVEVQNQ